MTEHSKTDSVHQAGLDSGHLAAPRAGVPSALTVDAPVAKFTPGPWLCAPTGPRMRHEYSQPFGIAQANTSNMIAGVFGDVLGGETVAEANARHIVQCVNACAGLPDGALDGGWNALDMSRYTKRLEDALHYIITGGEHWQDCVRHARAALSAAQGEKQ